MAAVTPDGRGPDGRAGAGAVGRPPVSVIMPARNAGLTLPAALRAILAQDYDGPLEVIVAEGSKHPANRDTLRRDFPQVQVLRNAAGTIPAGLNLALSAAGHEIIVRCDAHTVLPAGYISRAVDTLLRTGAANVGGRMHPAGAGFFRRAVALATSTPLGAGDARYRIGGKAGPVDTVYMGVYRRAALAAAGGWDETLLCNEDYALNWRLRERGETVWFDPALAADYRPRGNLAALARQYFNYGRWKRVMLKRHPRALRARQLAPPLLLAALAAAAPLGAVARLAAAGTLAPLVPASAWPRIAGVAAAVPLGYLLVLLAGSALIGIARRAPEALLLPVVAATIHLAWAAGFFAGIRDDSGKRHTGRSLPHAKAEMGTDFKSVPGKPAPRPGKARHDES